MRPLIFNLGAEQQLFQDLVAGLDAEVGELEHRHFPDGESYLRFDTRCAERNVVIACTLDRPNHIVLPLLLAAATLRDLEPRRIGLVAPYLAYMRQDKIFQSGEGVTARYFARMIGNHFDWMTTVDPHLHRIQSLDEIYPIPTEVAHAAPLIAAWIEQSIVNPLLIGPDSESEQWVAAIATRIEAPYLTLDKIRLGDRDVQVSVPQIEQYRECTPVLIDDIVSSGHTLVQTIRQLIAVGMPPPVCIAIHGVFAGDAATEITRAGVQRLVTCNTIEHPSNEINVASALVSACRNLL